MDLENNKSYSYEDKSKEFIDNYVFSDDKEYAIKKLSFDSLEKFFQSGKVQKIIELRTNKEHFVYRWVRINIMCLHNQNKILMTITDIQKEKLSHGIIDRLLCSECDYFVYLSANDNGYVMISETENGTPLPNEKGYNYSYEMEKYTEEFVVPEDRQHTLEQMKLNVVLKALETKEEHIIYCGINDPIRGYTHKCLRYKYYDEKNKILMLTRTDVTDVYLKENRKNEILKKSLKDAQEDSLTGLYNRRAFEMKIEKEINDGIISKGVFYFIDIDNFKTINDKMGHDAGDLVLIHLAKHLKKNFPKCSIYGRIGGDEFIAFDYRKNAQDIIDETANSICNAFENCKEVDFQNIKTSCSVGIALYPQQADNYSDLAKLSDSALYISKNNGRGIYTICKK